MATQHRLLGHSEVPRHPQGDRGNGEAAWGPKPERLSDRFPPRALSPFSPILEVV